MSSIFSFPTESPTSEKKIRADTLVSSFRMYYCCTKNESSVNTRMDTYKKKNPGKG